MSIYSSIGSENFQKSLAPSMVKISKKQDRTNSTELHSLFAKHIFNFRFRYFQLPISEKQLTSGFEVPTGSRKVPHAIDQVKLYTPQKFHANRFTRLGGDRFTHIKKTASELSDSNICRVSKNLRWPSGDLSCTVHACKLQIFNLWRKIDYWINFLV